MKLMVGVLCCRRRRRRNRVWVRQMERGIMMQVLLVVGLMRWIGWGAVQVMCVTVVGATVVFISIHRFSLLLRHHRSEMPCRRWPVPVARVPVQRLSTRRKEREMIDIFYLLFMMSVTSCAFISIRRVPHFSYRIELMCCIIMCLLATSRRYSAHI